MRRRIHQPSAGVPRINTILVEEPGRLITLEDPNAPPTLAQDAFARLRPPEGASTDAVASWRESVAKVAKAVRVMGTPTAALVPAASHRSDAAVVGTVRGEAEALAKETGNQHVIDLTKQLLDRFGVR